MVAQRAARVVAAKQPAPTQLRQHEFDEIVEAPGQRRRHHVVAVRAVLHEALLERIDDLLRCADELPMTARTRDPQIEFAYRQVLAAREVQRQRLPALAHIGFRQRRDRAVERIAGQIDAARQPRHEREPDLRVDQCLQRVEFFLRFAFGAANHRKDAGHDLQRVGVAPERGKLPFHVRVERDRVVERLLRGEDHLGRARGQPRAGRRRPGLHDDRMALRRACNVQRPAHLEEPSAMIEHVALVGIEETAARAIAHECVVVPAVPQPAHDVGEFLRARIAFAMLEMRVAVEVARLVHARRRDEVPARTAAADVVE